MRARLAQSTDKFLMMRAWATHFYTSLGLVASFLALIAAIDGRARDVFVYLAVALFIDATDGFMARGWNVLRWTPQFDGRKLDDITDYLTYVFIPAYFAYRFELVSGPWAVVLLAVLLSSAYGFCSEAAKTEDNFFTGFPSYWNVVVFYMYVLRTSVPVNGAILFFLAVMVFVPIKYLYPSRTKFWQPLTIGLGVLWALALLVLLIYIDNPPQWLAYASLLYIVYYFAVSFYLHFRDNPLPLPRPRRRN